MSHSSSNWKIWIQKRHTDNWTTKKNIVNKRTKEKKRPPTEPATNEFSHNFLSVYSSFHQVVSFFFFTLSCAIQFLFFCCFNFISFKFCSLVSNENNDSLHFSRWKWKCVQCRNEGRQWRFCECEESKPEESGIQKNQTHKCGWYLYGTGNEERKKKWSQKPWKWEITTSERNTMMAIYYTHSGNGYWKDVTANRHWALCPTTVKCIIPLKIQFNIRAKLEVYI